MRSGGRLWMVTSEPEPSPWHEDIPCYFKTRRDAENYATSPNLLEWLDLAEGSVLVVLPAPDDVRKDDIDWERN